MNLEADPRGTVAFADQDPIPQNAVGEVGRRMVQDDQVDRPPEEFLESVGELPVEALEGAGRSCSNKTATSTSLVSRALSLATLPNR